MPNVVGFIRSKSQEFRDFRGPGYKVRNHGKKIISVVLHPSSSRSQQKDKPFDSPDPIEIILQPNNDGHDNWNRELTFLKEFPEISKRFNWADYTHKKPAHHLLTLLLWNIEETLANNIPNFPSPVEKQLEKLLIKTDFLSPFFSLRDKSFNTDIQNLDLIRLVDHIDSICKRILFIHNYQFITHSSDSDDAIANTVIPFCEQLSSDYLRIDEMVFPDKNNPDDNSAKSRIFATTIFNGDNATLNALKCYNEPPIMQKDKGDHLLLNKGFSRVVSIHKIYGKAVGEKKIRISNDIDVGQNILASLMDLVENTEEKPACLLHMLQDLLDKEECLSINALQKLAQDIARGLFELHEAGLTHRDIKLDNILVEKDKFVITDWDLMKKLTRNRVNTAVGSPNYIAPEIIREESYDERIDLFSLGVSLYMASEMKVPFPPEDYHKVPFPRPQFHYTENQNLRNLISRLLSEDPNDRGTYRDLLRDPFLSENIP